jgi:hypothetical protein
LDYEVVGSGVEKLPLWAFLQAHGLVEAGIRTGAPIGLANRP